MGSNERGLHGTQRKIFQKRRENGATMKLIERFMNKVDRSGGEDACWIWTARKTPQGYGRFLVDGINLLAHRVSFEIHSGTSARGLCVLHRCDNPSCVNPAHLRLGTNYDNVQDKVSKGRHLTSGGMKNPNRKLSEADVIEIRALVSRGIRRRDIASKFNIAPSYVNDISSRKVWSAL
jgi:hypothetical protein